MKDMKVNETSRVDSSALPGRTAVGAPQVAQHVRFGVRIVKDTPVISDVMGIPRECSDFLGDAGHGCVLRLRQQDFDTETSGTTATVALAAFSDLAPLLVAASATKIRSKGGWQR